MSSVGMAREPCTRNWLQHPRPPLSPSLLIEKFGLPALCHHFLLRIMTCTDLWVNDCEWKKEKSPGSLNYHHLDATL